jgi:hypothetical protein
MASIDALTNTQRRIRVVIATCTIQLPLYPSILVDSLSQVLGSREIGSLGTGTHFDGYGVYQDLGDGAFGWSLYKVVRFHRISLALDFLRFVGIVDEPKYDSESQGRTSQGSNDTRCGLVEIKKDKSANQCQ